MTTETANRLTEYLKGAPTGSQLNCQGWLQEAPYRMLLNNLDPNVAENNEQLIVYGGNGKAARNPEALQNIVKALKGLKSDETLIIQSGKPVGILQTHKDAPRVLIANSLLVPRWATYDYFSELERQDLMMYGQMTAGSWIYIGTQGILQGTYETFGSLAAQHFDKTLKGKLNVTAGLGGMGGAQPLAITMNDGVCLAAEVDEHHIKRRIDTQYLDDYSHDLDQAIDKALAAKNDQQPYSVAYVGNAIELLQRLDNRGIVPDTLTDQTSAHDPLYGYIPEGLSVEEAKALRNQDRDTYIHRSKETMARHVQLMLNFQNQGTITFDYGNNLRGQAKDYGIEDAFNFPGFVPAYIRPEFSKGNGPFRWVALSGDPEDIYETDRALMELFPENQRLQRWLKMAQDQVAFQGLPARICWLNVEERAKAGLAFNRLVAEGKVKAPIVIGRDHLDTGSVASPNRETESMADGSDAVADWPILNALINASSGATWVSVHHGGGVGIGNSIHAGMVIVADGSEDADARLQRVLTNDPASGVIRHADAGYDIAKDTARQNRLDIQERL
jgi:urocanate hydratase